MLATGQMLTKSVQYPRIRFQFFTIFTKVLLIFRGALKPLFLYPPLGARATGLETIEWTYIR